MQGNSSTIIFNIEFNINKAEGVGSGIVSISTDIALNALQLVDLSVEARRGILYNRSLP
jgi:hypothetical protein